MLRPLRQYRLLTLAFVLTLGAGVGITAAIFNAIDALLFRPPAHVTQPERIVRVRSARNYVQYQRLQTYVRSLDLAAYARATFTTGTDRELATLRGECVTPNYFDLIGTTPAAGRLLSNAMASSDASSAIISDGLWTRMFGRDGDLSRLRLSLSGRNYNVIAVARRGFTGIDSEPVDVWLSLASSPEICTFTDRNLLGSDGGTWLRTIGRLRPTVTLAQAEAEFAAIGSLSIDRDQTLPSEPEILPLAASRRNRLSLEARTGLWSAGGALMVLLIACANVVVFMALRAMDRRAEVAIRLQLGATPARVFLLFLRENLVLTALCLASAIAVAVWMEGALRSFFPLRLPGLSLAALGIVAGFTLFMGLVSTVIPAIQVARAQSASLLRTGTRAAQPGSRHRSLLLATQLALAQLLLVAGAAFLQSVDRLTNEAGYHLDDVVVATVELERSGYSTRETWKLIDRVMDRVRQEPAVSKVSVSSATLLGSGGMIVSVGISPVPVTPYELPPMGQGAQITMNAVSADYFATLGTRILRGRAFTGADDAQAKVVGIVDQGVARRFWGNEDPIGKCVFLATGQSCIEVVGVSESRRSGYLTWVQDEFFVPSTQAALHHSLHQTPRTLFVRTETPMRDVIPLIASALERVAPESHPSKIRPLLELANEQTRSWRLGAATFYLYGILAALMAAAGLYGAIALAIRQRTGEIAIRMVLGATPLNVARMMLRNVATILVVGWVVGTALTLMFGRLMDHLLFEVTPGDPSILFKATGLMCAIAVAGCMIPVIRIVRLNPSSALRQS